MAQPMFTNTPTRLSGSAGGGGGGFPAGNVARIDSYGPFAFPQPGPFQPSYSAAKPKPDFGSPYSGGTTYIQPYIVFYAPPSPGEATSRNAITPSRIAMPQSPLRRI